jgi:hypothetical protein
MGDGKDGKTEVSTTLAVKDASRGVSDRTKRSAFGRLLDRRGRVLGGPTRSIPITTSGRPPCTRPNRCATTTACRSSPRGGTG